MGYLSATLEQVTTAIRLTGKSPDEIRMLELGNQRFHYTSPQHDKPHESATRYFFEELGVDYTSVDRNGLDGAIALDLSIPHSCWLSKFDIVTDIGTSEHVNDTYACHLNIYNWCKMGGIFCFALPLTGNWPGHGRYFVTMETWRVYADLTQSTVISVVAALADASVSNSTQLHAILKKTGKSEFISRDQFATIPLAPS